MTYAPAAARQLPPLPRLLAAAFSAVVLFALLRSYFLNGVPPMWLTFLAAVIQIGALVAVGAGRNPAAAFLRSGFHLGLFSFFVFYPLIAPEESGFGFVTGTSETVGWMIILTIIGFEVAYWFTRLGRAWPGDRRTRFAIEPQHEKVLQWLQYIGIVAWFVTIVDHAVSADVPVLDVLLSMRGPVVGPRDDVARFLSGSLVILHRVLEGGLLLAATAASVLLVTGTRQSRAMNWLAWAGLVVCAVGGFLSGTRATFFYAFMPLLVTSWLRLSHSRLQHLRWLMATGALVMMLLIWGAMSVLRGADIRTFQGDLASMTPAQHARGAFDIYSQLGMVVQAFPAVFPYQEGASLLPLALGWVPRAFWPDKPYPFSLFMNFLNGETLENRSASLAVGLPGEGYGNFGLLGVFLWAAMAGFVCRRGDDHIGDFHPDHPLRLQIASMSAIWVAMVVRGGVPEMFYQGLQVMLLPLGIAIYLFRAEEKAQDCLPVHSPTGPLTSQPATVRRTLISDADQTHPRRSPW